MKTDMKPRLVVIGIFAGLLIWALLFYAGVSAFAQEEEFYKQQPQRSATPTRRGGREMTEEEKREMDEWVKRGSKTEITITQAKPKAIGIDWETVFKNPLTWICIGVVVFGALALRELGGIQQSVNAIDRINKRMRRSLEEEHDRLIEQEARSGKPFQFENPENARWWEEEKRKRGK